MNDKALAVVPYERARHEPALLQFIEKVLGVERCARRRKVLDSIHDRMPGRDRFPLRHVILDGDRVAGSMGHLPADFLVKGERKPVRFTHDLLVDPDYRGRGLAKLVVEHARAQGGFFPGGMWMTDPCYKIHLACGFDEVAPLVTYTLVLDPAAFVARRGLSPLKSAASRLGLRITRSRALNRAREEIARTGASAREIERFDPTLDNKWLHLARGYGITRIREAAYLNWKYADHPHLRYRLLLASTNGAEMGYMVWRIAPEGAVERRAVIADFLVEKGDSAAFRHLLSRVIADASSSGMESLSVLTTQPWAAACLRSFGFFPRGARSTWVIAGWQDHIPSGWLHDHATWHVCLGDSDGDIWTGS